MKVSVSELRNMSERLFDHLESGGNSQLEIPQDYYWYVPTKERYQPYVEPKGLTLGQLSDDWAELQKIIRGESEPIDYALVWLSTILRVIGEKVPG